MHLRKRSFYDACEIDIEPAIHIRRKAGLHAYFGSTEVHGFFDTSKDFIIGKKVSLLVPIRPAECAKTAVLDADVGEVDVSIDDISDDVTYLLASKFIGGQHQHL